MKADEFDSVRKRAGELFKIQHLEKNKVSLDTIFLALVLDPARGAPERMKRTADEAPPEWFKDTLEKLRGTGERVTVGRFLLLAGKFPSTRSDSLKTSQWLREAGFIPKKTGGNLLFEL